MCTQHISLTIIKLLPSAIAIQTGVETRAAKNTKLETLFSVVDNEQLESVM